MQSHLKLDFVVCILVFQKYFYLPLLILTWVPRICGCQLSISIYVTYEVNIVYVCVSIYTYMHILENLKFSIYLGVYRGLGYNIFLFSHLC